MILSGNTKSPFNRNLEKACDPIFFTPSCNFIVVPFEKEIKSKVEKNDKFSQSYLIALYNIDTNIDSDEKEHFAALLYSFLLHDRYFDVVREKHGLCYAISNTYLNTNNAFRMTAGIDASKYRKTLSLANKEIEKIKKGKISKKHWKYYTTLNFTN